MGRHESQKSHKQPSSAGEATSREGSRESAGGRGAVVVVGGKGGLSSKYREIVEEKGLELRHYETRVPNGARKMAGKVAALIVIAGMVSHSLRDQAKALVPSDAPVVYLRTASVSALREAVASLDVGSNEG